MTPQEQIQNLKHCGNRQLYRTATLTGKTPRAEIVPLSAHLTDPLQQCLVIFNTALHGY